MKLPYMKFYPADWIKDTRSLTPEAKAAWIDFLAFSWEAKERGQLQMSLADWARTLGQDPEKMTRIVHELKDKQIADVTERNGEILIVSRRIVKDEMSYKNNAIRQMRFRDKRKHNEKVTPQMSDVRCQITDKTAIAHPQKPDARPFKASMKDFENFWAKYPRRLGRKRAERFFFSSITAQTDLALIEKALKNYLDSKTYRDGFVQYGDTWTNNWRDWIDHREGVDKVFEDEAEKKKKREEDRRAKNLSECHGSPLQATPDDDGFFRCGACLQIQKWKTNERPSLAQAT